VTDIKTNKHNTLPTVLHGRVGLASYRKDVILFLAGPDGIKGDINEALVALGSVLHTLVDFVINCCLVWFVLSLGCGNVWFY